MAFSNNTNETHLLSLQINVSMAQRDSNPVRRFETGHLNAEPSRQGQNKKIINTSKFNSLIVYSLVSAADLFISKEVALTITTLTSCVDVEVSTYTKNNVVVGWEIAHFKGTYPHMCPFRFSQ